MKWQNDEMVEWQFFKRENEMYVLNVLNLQRLSFQIQWNPARKHSTPLRHNLGIIGSCRVPLELISTLNCLLFFHHLALLCCMSVVVLNVKFRTLKTFILLSLLKNCHSSILPFRGFAILCFKHAPL